MATPCRQFHANSRVNPRTRRIISPNGQLRECGPSSHSDTFSPPSEFLPPNYEPSSYNWDRPTSSPSSYTIPDPVTNVIINPIKSFPQIDALVNQLRNLNFGNTITPLTNVLQSVSSIAGTSSSFQTSSQQNQNLSQQNQNLPPVQRFPENIQGLQGLQGLSQQNQNLPPVQKFPENIPQQTLNVQLPQENLLLQQTFRIPSFQTLPPPQSLQGIATNNIFGGFGVHEEYMQQQTRSQQNSSALRTVPVGYSQVPEPLIPGQSIMPGQSITMPTQISTSPNCQAQTSPQPNIGMPRPAHVSTSQEIPNGCVTSIIGRSGEDRYVNARLNGNIQMYGVFDGHGGRTVAEYLRDNLPQALAEALMNVNFTDENAVRTAVTNAYIGFDMRMFNQGMRSGSTAIVALYMQPSLYLINLGDARAVVFDNNLQILAQTRDHKPNEESERIQAAGGFVANFGTWRVNSVLAVSRAFGDFDFKYTLTSQPAQFTTGNAPDNIARNVYNPRGPVSVIPDVTRVINARGSYILLASDGIYDVFSSQAAVDSIVRSGNITGACQRLVEQARRGTTDDITVIIAPL